jgi:thiol:disulfide interchange protein
MSKSSDFAGTNAGANSRSNSLHEVQASFWSRRISIFTAGIALALLLMCGPVAGFAAGVDIYPAPEKAEVELKAALRTAALHHKRVILDFGGNWCGDCKVLDIYFRDPVNAGLIEANYVMVHINIGSSSMDQNQKIAEHYQIPLAKGVPALAVLDENGKLLYSQRSGEFEAMRRMDPSSVTSFLLQWKPGKPGA